MVLLNNLSNDPGGASKTSPPYPPWVPKRKDYSSVDYDCVNQTLGEKPLVTRTFVVSFSLCIKPYVLDKVDTEVAKNPINGDNGDKRVHVLRLMIIDGVVQNLIHTLIYTNIGVEIHSHTFYVYVDHTKGSS